MKQQPVTVEEGRSMADKIGAYGYFLFIDTMVMNSIKNMCQNIFTVMILLMRFSCLFNKLLF